MICPLLYLKATFIIKILIFMLVWLACLEDDITYFKIKEKVIIFGDNNARTKGLQLDAQKYFMPHISVTLLLLQMVYLYGLKLMVRKYNVVIDNVLLSKTILDCRTSFYLVKGHHNPIIGVYVLTSII